MNKSYERSKSPGEIFFTVMFAVLAICAVGQIADCYRTMLKAHTPVVVAAKPAGDAKVIVEARAR